MLVYRPSEGILREQGRQESRQLLKECMARSDAPEEAPASSREVTALEDRGGCTIRQHKLSDLAGHPAAPVKIVNMPAVAKCETSC